MFEKTRKLRKKFRDIREGRFENSNVKMSSDKNKSNFLNDSSIDSDMHTSDKLHLKYNELSTKDRKLLHTWSHQLLFKAIKMLDFDFFEELINNIIEDMSWKQIFYSICLNSIIFFNPTLGDTYLNIVRRNGLSQFEEFLLSKVEFNRMNEIYNSFIDSIPKGNNADMLAVFLEQETRNPAANLDISLHIAVRRHDLICAYMLLSKGACADISVDGDITALHLAVLKRDVRMVKLILMASQQPLDIDSYRDNYNRTTREVIRKLKGLSFHSNVFEDLPIPPIKEQTLKFFLNNCEETMCLKVMKEGFHGELSHDVAEELLNIAIRRNYCKIVQHILGKFNESSISLNVVKNIAVIHGNHAVLRKLLKLQPEVTNDLIMNAYQLLRMSSQEMSNMADRLKCLNLILEQNKIRISDEMIFKMSELQPYDEFNFFGTRLEDWKSMEDIPEKSSSLTLFLNYFWIQCCNLCRLCRLCLPKKHLIVKNIVSGRFTSAECAIRPMTDELNRKLYFIGMMIGSNKGNSYKHVDLLASILEELTTRNNISFETALNKVLHIAVRRNDLICTYMLLCIGASASDPNIHNMTALHLAARNGNVDMVRLIMMASQQPPDIDSYRGYNNQTTREVIENLPELSFHSNFFEDLQIPPIKEQTLKFFLNNSDETKCLKVMKEGFHGELSHNVAKELLNIAMRRNYYKIIREILGNINENPITLNKDKWKAVLCDNHAILRVLFKLQPEIPDDLIMYACRRLKISPQEIDNTSDRLECLKLMLEQEHVDVRCTDGLSNTPLHYALKASSYEAAILLLKRGSYLGHVNKSNNIVIANIPEFVLSSYFNDCIQVKEEWTDECTIEFDYRCLMPHDDSDEQYETYQTTREMEVILYIANNDTLKHLLKHPLLSSFLYIKWYRIRHVLYANFVFYMMFYFFLNAYVLNMTYTSKSGKQITNDSFDTVFANTLQSACSQGIFLWAFVMGMLLLFACREFLQFVFGPWSYLTHLKNWLQILLIVLTFTLLCGAGFQIGVMVILLSTWELITLISHHLLPSTSSTIEMFRTVLFNFVRFFFPYIFLIFAFALAFHILFRNDSFSNPGLSLFKTIIMLTGEFDANNISFSDNEYSVFSRLVFVLFIFNIVIVLLNLLKGLAISDIAKILNKAEIIGLISRIHLIMYFERMVIGKPLCWNSQWLWNSFNFLSNRILLFPHFLKNGKMSFKPYDNLIVYDKDMGDNRSLFLKMDPNIIKNAKQIVYDKNKLSNNDIMNEFANLQARLTQIKVTLKCYNEENIF